ncbi:MAG: hypothetical protein HY665_04055 [Chloroflexi bacterium]|nr:hypothetical protein [Chloroflexota bacterium]
MSCRLTTGGLPPGLVPVGTSTTRPVLGQSEGVAMKAESAILYDPVRDGTIGQGDAVLFLADGSRATVKASRVKFGRGDVAATDPSPGKLAKGIVSPSSAFALALSQPAGESTHCCKTQRGVKHVGGRPSKQGSVCRQTIWCRWKAGQAVML